MCRPGTHGRRGTSPESTAHQDDPDKYPARTDPGHNTNRGTDNEADGSPDHRTKDFGNGPDARTRANGSQCPGTDHNRHTGPNPDASTDNNASTGGHCRSHPGAHADANCNSCTGTNADHVYVARTHRRTGIPLLGLRL